jgi:hypothetical protein
VWVVVTYISHRHLLRVAFNDFACAIALLQSVESLLKLFFSVATLTNGGLPAWACDVSGSVDQWLEVCIQLLTSCFFIAIAHVRRVNNMGIQQLWKLYFSIASVSSLILIFVWVFLSSGYNSSAVHFTQEAAWCWLPLHAKGYSGISESDLDVLKFFSGYFFVAVCIVVAVYAFVHRGLYKKIPSTGQSLFVLRIVGIGAFASVAYTVSALCRYEMLPQAISENLSRAVLSLIVPLVPAVYSMCFLISERALTALCIEQAQISNGFTSLVCAAMCGEVIGSSLSIPGCGYTSQQPFNHSDEYDVDPDEAQALIGPRPGSPPKSRTATLAKVVVVHKSSASFAAT